MVPHAVFNSNRQNKPGLSPETNPSNNTLPTPNLIKSVHWARKPTWFWKWLLGGLNLDPSSDCHQWPLAHSEWPSSVQLLSNLWNQQWKSLWLKTWTCEFRNRNNYITKYADFLVFTVVASQIYTYKNYRHRFTSPKSSGYLNQKLKMFEFFLSLLANIRPLKEGKN